MLVEAVYCALVRFKCIGCGKTFAFYPDFAVPYKHYTRQTVLKFSKSYVEDDQETYEDAVMTVDGMPERSENGQSLAPSSIHRWISTLAAIWIHFKKRNLHASVRHKSPRKSTEHWQEKRCC
jgi:hypothetical protein